VDTRFVAFGVTDIGKVREENQDAFYIDSELNLYLVADGMGGMRKGALAAQYVVKSFPKLVKQKIQSLQDGHKEEVPELLRQAIAEISKKLNQRQGKRTGATIVTALIIGEKAYVANLGDSRAYLLRRGKLNLLTKDHNLASILVEMNKITPEESATHPAHNQLTAYVGMENPAKPAVTQVTLKPNDRLLLCTDGLTGMVPDAEIAQVLAAPKNPQEALHVLVEEANRAGGRDNITAVLVTYQSSSEKLGDVTHEG
jgi:protein phosphatase